METVRLYTSEEYNLNNTEVNIDNTVDENNVHVVQAMNYSESSNNCTLYPNNQKKLGTNEVKAEDVDTLEQFMEEHGFHNSKIFKIKNQIDKIEQLYESKDLFNVKSAITQSQDGSVPNMSKFNSEQVIAISRVEKCSANRSSKHKIHECQLCDYDTNNQNLFRQHADSAHLNLKQFKCNLCNYCVNRRYRLKEHMESAHLKLKEHKCDLCDYATNLEMNLKRHINTVHLNIKNYVCHRCQYAACNNADLQRHIESVHLNVKQFKCNLCDYAVNRKFTLEQHIDSVHLKLKQHKCEFCDYASNHKANLRRHVDTIHLNLKQDKSSKIL